MNVHNLIYKPPIHYYNSVPYVRKEGFTYYLNWRSYVDRRSASNRPLGPPLSVCNVMITWHFMEVMIRKKCKELLSTI